MKKILFNTSESASPLLLRIFLALVIFPHGAQKLLGWFGGFGYTGTMSYFTDHVGLPYVIGLLIILLESIGAILLLTGFATRFLAGFFLVLAVGIIVTSHWENGFFMNWYGNQAGEGYEYFLLWIGMALALVYSGAGRYSFDRLMSR
ncbi:DoxX family protein [Marinoscillum sp.]|uniref:DoxX family protein n=1 Tax=Marinoscillum sp. TaxID=2024838 RepID=UPI003BA99D23